MILTVKNGKRQLVAHLGKVIYYSHTLVYVHKVVI
jgi:hypothetical protein